MRQIRNIMLLLAAVLFASMLEGCASVKMEPTTVITKAKPDKALVTFVRPAIFAGDAIGVDIWDSEHYLGSLDAGTMVQYEAEPGEHLFLANSENWSYTSAVLQPGKRYYIKANIFPGVFRAHVALGVAENDDKRISEWMTNLPPKTGSPSEMLKVDQEKQAVTQENIKNFKDGKVTRFTTIGPTQGLE